MGNAVDVGNPSSPKLGLPRAASHSALVNNYLATKATGISPSVVSSEAGGFIPQRSVVFASAEGIAAGVSSPSYS